MISLQDKAIKLEITTYDLQRGTNCPTVFTYSANTNPKPQCGRKHRECAHLTKKDDYLRMCFYYEVIPVIIFLNQKNLLRLYYQMSSIHGEGWQRGQKTSSIHGEGWQRQRNACLFRPCPNCVGFVLLCARIEHRACYIRQGLYHWTQLQPNQILEQT